MEKMISYVLERLTMSEIIDIKPEDIRVVETKEYNSIESFFVNLPDIAHPIILDAETELKMIEGMMMKAPALIKVVQAIVPSDMLVAVLSDSQKTELAKGALELMTKKDGSLMAVLRNPSTKKIVDNINLKNISFSPEIATAMNDFSSQIQMAQLASEVHHLQIAVERVQRGQDCDRLSTAYSLQEKYKLACSIKDPELKKNALLRLTMDAEDCRNMLMLNQSAEIQILLEQPEELWKKFFSSIKTKDNDNILMNVRSSMLALNMASVVEALAYQSLGEKDNAILSLEYYADFMNKTYGNEKELQRLDSLDPAEEKFWSGYLPTIKNSILSLPKKEWFNLLEDNQHNLIEEKKDNE